MLKSTMLILASQVFASDVFQELRPFDRLIGLYEYLNDDIKLYDAHIANESLYSHQMEIIGKNLEITKFLFHPENRLNEAKKSEVRSHEFVCRLISSKHPFYDCTNSFIEHNIYLWKSKHLRNFFYLYNFNIDDPVCKFLNSKAPKQTAEVKVDELFDFFKDLILKSKKFEEHFYIERLESFWNTVDKMIKYSYCKHGIAKESRNLNDSTEMRGNVDFEGELESINEKSSLLRHVWYLCSFIDQKIVLYCDTKPSAGTFAKILINFANISTLVLDLLKKNSKTNKIEVNAKEFRESIEVNNLSIRLESEMIRFMEIYVHAYKQMHLHYLRSYKDGDMEQIEIFRIGSTILEAIMCMMNLVCNFKNIINQEELKAYELDIEFIEKKLKFESFAPVSMIVSFFKSPFRNTGFKRMEHGFATPIERFLTSFVNLLKLPINFTQNETNVSEFNELEFSSLVEEYTKNKFVDKIKNSENIKRMLKLGCYYISNINKLKPTELSNGELRWIQIYCTNLFKYVNNLKALKTHKLLAFGLDDLKPTKPDEKNK